MNTSNKGPLFVVIQFFSVMGEDEDDGMERGGGFKNYFFDPPNPENPISAIIAGSPPSSSPSSSVLRFFS